MARVGSISCPAAAYGCNNLDATVSETGAKTLNVSCHRCGVSSYAKQGTKAHRLITAHMTPDADAPAKTAAPAAPPAAPVKRAATLLG